MAGIYVDPKQTRFNKFNIFKNKNHNVNYTNQINTKADTDYEMIDYSSPITLSSIDYKNIIDDGYTVQGMTLASNKMLITAYSKNESKDGTKPNSRIYIYDLNSGNYEGMFIIDTNAHVGGATYDEDNDILYITGKKGKVHAYDYSQLQKSINDVDINPFKIDFKDIDDAKISKYIIPSDISIKEYGSAATTYYYDGYLYVATFTGQDDGTLARYKTEIKIDKDGNKKIVIDKDNVQISRVPKQTQGLAFTEYNSKKYMLISQSVGMAKSSIMVYEYDDTKDTFIFAGRTYTDHGMQGIDVTEDGQITTVFEDNTNLVAPRNNTYVTTMDELLKNMSKGANNWEEIVAEVGGFIYDVSK